MKKTRRQYRSIKKPVAHKNITVTDAENTAKKMKRNPNFKQRLREYYKKQGITPEIMKRLMYKDLVDTNPELVEKRLKERQEKLYQSVLRELSEKEARKFADSAFWWID